MATEVCGEPVRTTSKDALRHPHAVHRARPYTPESSIFQRKPEPPPHLSALETPQFGFNKAAIFGSAAAPAGCAHTPAVTTLLCLLAGDQVHQEGSRERKDYEGPGTPTLTFGCPALRTQLPAPLLLPGTPRGCCALSCSISTCSALSQENHGHLAAERTPRAAFPRPQIHPCQSPAEHPEPVPDPIAAQAQKNLPFSLEPDRLSQPQMLSSASCSPVLPRSRSSRILGMTQGPRLLLGASFAPLAQLETWHRRPQTRGRNDPQHLTATETWVPHASSLTFRPALNCPAASLFMRANDRRSTRCGRASCSSRQAPVLCAPALCPGDQPSYTGLDTCNCPSQGFPHHP